MRRPKVAILNEHPTWQLGLRDELNRRDIAFCEIPIQGSFFCLNSDEFEDISLVINRSSPSALKRKNHASLFFTLQLIEHFEQLGIPVINGSQAYALEISKARQCQLFKQLGLPFPRTIVVNSSEEVIKAAKNLPPGVVLKPNIAGSGLGYRLFRNPQDLTVDKAARILRRSLDKTAVLQEFINPDNDTTYRVQMIGLDHRYTISARGGGSNKCLSPNCNPHGSRSGCSKHRPKFAEHTESKKVIEEVQRIVVAGGFDTCGVEYLIRNGKRYYYDINALSVFADSTQIQFAPGDDPTVRFVNLIEERLSEVRRRAA